MYHLQSIYFLSFQLAVMVTNSLGANRNSVGTQKGIAAALAPRISSRKAFTS